MVPEVRAARAEGAGSGPLVRVPSLLPAAHPAPSRPGNVREQHVGPPAAQQGAQVQATCHGEQPGPGGSDPGLHEPAGNDLQHVWPHAQVEVVCLDCCLLFLHQLCQLSKLRRYQADDEQLHALHFCCGDVLPPEPSAYDASVVDTNLLAPQPGPQDPRAFTIRFWARIKKKPETGSFLTSVFTSQALLQIWGLRL